MGALPSERCSKGHLMQDPNLYHRRDGKRECLTCKRERNRGRKPSGDLDDRKDSRIAECSTLVSQVATKNGRYLLPDKRERPSVHRIVGGSASKIERSPKLSTVGAGDGGQLDTVSSQPDRGNARAGTRIDLLLATIEKRHNEPRFGNIPVMDGKSEKHMGEEIDRTHELMCSYTEYDPETGETYRCGREVHGPKVNHTKGKKL